MKRSIVLLAAVLAAITLVGSAFADEGDGGRVLRAQLVGSNPAGPLLFGVQPGGAPWVITASDVDVRRSGRIEVKIRGLVIPGVGTGAVQTVTASLYCNGDRAGTTAPVPLSTDGDAEIRDTVTVPAPCLAPAVLVNPNGGVTRYIAATGA